MYYSSASPGAPHQHTPQWPSLVSYSGTRLDRQCNRTLCSTQCKPFPVGPIGRKVGHRAAITHTPHPGLCFHWVQHGTASLSGNSTDTFLLRLRGASRSSNTSTSCRQWSNVTCDTSARTSAGWTGFLACLLSLPTEMHRTALRTPVACYYTHNGWDGDAVNATVTCFLLTTTSHCAGVGGTV